MKVVAKKDFKCLHAKNAFIRNLIEHGILVDCDLANDMIKGNELEQIVASETSKSEMITNEITIEGTSNRSFKSIYNMYPFK